MTPDRFPDRLRHGDAAALLELAHTTYGRALAVARAAGWSDDPEAVLLDAYVALYLRRADAPDALTEQWALAEVLAYCEARAASAARPAPTRARAVRSLGSSLGVLARAGVQTVVRAVLGRSRPSAVPATSVAGGSVG